MARRTASATAIPSRSLAEEGEALRELYENVLMERTEDVSVVRGGEPGDGALEQDPRLRNQLRAQEVAALRANLRPARTAKEARSGAGRFVGRALTNVETGVEATVSEASLNHYLSEKDVSASTQAGVPARVHMLAVANLDTLFHVAARSNVSIPRDPIHARWKHIFDAPLPYGDDIYRVRLLVLEYRDPKDGSRIYSVQVREIAPVSSGAIPGGGDGLGPAHRRDLAGDTVKPPSGVSPIFDQLVRIVKGETDTLYQDGPGLFDEDVLDTGERQPRLPGEVGAVREEERPTPREELPEQEFRLTSEVAKPRRRKQPRLLALSQAAWHGSPHIFEKFSLHAIGTGEGAQAYGWGLYSPGTERSPSSIATP